MANLVLADGSYRQETYDNGVIFLNVNVPKKYVDFTNLQSITYSDVVEECRNKGININFDDFIIINSDNLVCTEIDYSEEYYDTGAFEECKLTNAKINTLTSIGEGTFRNCRELSSASFSNAKVISKQAFMYCEQLNDFNIADNIILENGQQFDGCRELTADFRISSFVGDDNSYIFNNCSSLTTISFGDNITCIPYGTFRNCKNLSTVNSNNISSISSYCFEGCNRLAIDVDSISVFGDYCFKDNTYLKIITINHSQTFGHKVFFGCNNLIKIDMSKATSIPSIQIDSFDIDDNGNTVIKIIVPYSLYEEWRKSGNWTHYKNILIAANNPNLRLGSDVKCLELSNGSYMYSNKLSTIIDFTGYDSIGESDVDYELGKIEGRDRSTYFIPVFNDTISAISSNAFDYCHNITQAILPDSIIEIGDYAFNNCYSLSNYRWSTNITSIGDYAFFACYEMSATDFPDSIVHVGKYAFYEYAINVKDRCIKIPSSMISIDVGSFSAGLNSYSSISIHNNITSINYYGFAANYKVSSISVDSFNPPELGEDVFQNLGYNVDPTIQKVCYIPTGSYDLYNSNEKWLEFRLTNGFKFDDGIPHGDIRLQLSSSALRRSLKDGFVYCSYDYPLVDFTQYNYINKTIVDAELARQEIQTDDFHPVFNEQISAIGLSSFSDRSINKIQLPNSILSIEDCAFYNCKELSINQLPSNLTYVGNYAFACCKQINRLSFDSSLTSIGDYCFYGLNYLSTIYANSSVPPSIGENTFGNCGISVDSSIQKTCYIPNGSFNSYDYNDNWSKLQELGYVFNDGTPHENTRYTKIFYQDGVSAILTASTIDLYDIETAYPSRSPYKTILVRIIKFGRNVKEISNKHHFSLSYDLLQRAYYAEFNSIPDIIDPTAFSTFGYRNSLYYKNNRIQFMTEYSVDYIYNKYNLSLEINTDSKISSVQLAGIVHTNYTDRELSNNILRVDDFIAYTHPTLSGSQTLFNYLRYYADLTTDNNNCFDISSLTIKFNDNDLNTSKLDNRGTTLKHKASSGSYIYTYTSLIYGLEKINTLTISGNKLRSIDCCFAGTGDSEFNRPQVTVEKIKINSSYYGKTLGSNVFSYFSTISALDGFLYFTTIGENAFSYSNIYIDRFTPFYIVKTIKSNAFRNSKLYGEITFAYANIIGDSAFENTVFGENIKFNSYFTSLGSSAFKNSNISKLSVSIDSIPSYAFQNCKNLTSINNMYRIQTICDDAFNGDIKLTGFTNTVQGPININDRAFANCSSFVFPDEFFVYTQHIGHNALIETCVSSLHFSNALTSYNTNYFYQYFAGLPKIQKISVDSTNTYYSSKIDSIETNCLINLTTNSIVQGSKRPYLGSPISSNVKIGIGAFCNIQFDNNYRSWLSNNNIISSIDSYAFYGTNLNIVRLSAVKGTLKNSSFGELKTPITDFYCECSSDAGAFYNTPFDGNINIPYLESFDYNVYIQNCKFNNASFQNLKTIKYKLFTGSKFTNSLVIPQVSSIGQYAFASCTFDNVSTIFVQPGVQIGAHAFENSTIKSLSTSL